VNEDDKDMAEKNDYQHELTELLNLLETVDQQITPQHIDDRFSELLKNVEDDSETLDNVVMGEFSQSVSDEIPDEYADDSHAVESIQVSDRRNTSLGDLIDFVAVAEHRRAGCDEGVALMKAAYDQAARIEVAPVTTVPQIDGAGKLPAKDTRKRGYFSNRSSSGSAADDFTYSKEGPLSGSRANNHRREVILTRSIAAVIIAISCVLGALGGALGVRMSSSQPASLQTRSTPSSVISKTTYITFKSGTSEFANPAYAASELTTIADQLHIDRSSQVTLVSIANPLTSGAYARQLFLKRAEVVRSELIELGAPSGSVQLDYGSGQQQPGWNEDGNSFAGSSIAAILATKSISQQVIPPSGK